jgi:monoamine oxidase
VTAFDRRALIKGAAGAGGAALGAPLPPRIHVSATSANTAELDVAIVGGGVAGTYCAWRLSSPDALTSPALDRRDAGAPLRIALFEAGDRIGGRLWSFTPPGMPHLRAELGGARIPVNQTVVISLLDHLGIETRAVGGGNDRNLYYLRGRRFTVADLARPDRVPYELPRRFRGKSVAEIVIETIERLIPNASLLDDAAWTAARRTATLADVPLRDLGFHYAMERSLPPEAFALVRDGMNLDVRNGSAPDIIFEIAGAARPWGSVVTPRLGMAEIPLALARLAERQGVDVFRGHRVARITPAAGVASGDLGLLLEVEMAETGEVRRFAARHVILALPPRAIALLAPDSLPLTEPSYRRLQSALDPVPAGKIFLGYERPWWRDLGILAGRSITDLPLTATAYLGTEGEQPGAGRDNEASLLMASYAEGAALDYWATFRQLDPDSPEGANFQRLEIGAPPELGVPQLAVQELQRQLRRVHGESVSIGRPTFAAMADWSRDPYGAGYHFWVAGADPWALVPQARAPIPGLNLSLCGEAWSSGHGWVLGALTSAERTLQTRLELPWPDWLPTGVELGP